MNSSLFWTTKKWQHWKHFSLGAGEEAQQWRKGKEREEGREAGKNRGGRSVTGRLPRASEWGLLPRRRKNFSLVHQWALEKKKMKSMLAEGISPVTPNTTEEKVENFEVQAFLICWQSWLRKSRKVERNIKINPKKGSGNKIKSKLHVSMLTTNYTKTNSKAFGIN